MYYPFCDSKCFASVLVTSGWCGLGGTLRETSPTNTGNWGVQTLKWRLTRKIIGMKWTTRWSYTKVWLISWQKSHAINDFFRVRCCHLVPGGVSTVLSRWNDWLEVMLNINSKPEMSVIELHILLVYTAISYNLEKIQSLLELTVCSQTFSYKSIIWVKYTNTRLHSPFLLNDYLLSI